MLSPAPGSSVGTDLTLEMPAPSGSPSGWVVSVISFDDTGDLLEHGETSTVQCGGGVCSADFELVDLSDGITLYAIAMANLSGSWVEHATASYVASVGSTGGGTGGGTGGTGNFELVGVNGASPGSSLPSGTVTFDFSNPPSGASGLTVLVRSSNHGSWSFGGLGSDDAWIEMGSARSLTFPGEQPLNDYFTGDDLPAFPTDGTTITIVTMYEDDSGEVEQSWVFTADGTGTGSGSGGGDDGGDTGGGDDDDDDTPTTGTGPTSLSVYFGGHSGINNATPAYAAYLADAEGLTLTEDHCAVSGGFIENLLDPSMACTANNYTAARTPLPAWDALEGDRRDYDYIVVTEQSALRDVINAMGTFAVDTSAEPACSTIRNQSFATSSDRQSLAAARSWGGTGNAWESPAHMQIFWDVARCYQPTAEVCFFDHWDDFFLGEDVGYYEDTSELDSDPINLTQAGAYRSQVTNDWLPASENLLAAINRNQCVIPVARALRDLIQTMENGTAPGFSGGAVGSNGRLKWFNYLVAGDGVHLTNAGLYFTSLVTTMRLFGRAATAPIPTATDGSSLFSVHNFGTNDGSLVESNSVPASLDWGPNASGTIYITPALREHFQDVAWAVVSSQIQTDAQ